MAKPRGSIYLLEVYTGGRWEPTSVAALDRQIARQERAIWKENYPHQKTRIRYYGLLATVPR